MNPLDEIFGATRRPGTDDHQTLDRIADAVELIAAVSACEFYTRRCEGHPNLQAATDRLVLLVTRMSTRFAKRHGA